MKPRIAMTSSFGPQAGRLRVHVPATYVDAVVAGGGVPVVLPARPDDWSADELLAVADGLLLTGGDDLDPALWGEARHPKAVVMEGRRQRADLALIALADAHRVPVLGLCLGIQEMAVARGGRLIQHVPDEPAATLDHSGPAGRGGRPGRPRAMHPVTMEADSLLARIVGPAPLAVNSTHHQAAREPGRGMRVAARSPDGLIEGIEDPTPGRFFLGVQWHPEDLVEEPRHLALFQALCRAAAERRNELR